MTGRASADSIAEAEYNDSVENATEIAVNTSVVGNLSDSSDDDWFSFELTSAGVIHFDFQHPVIASTSNYWTITLWDELGLSSLGSFSVIGNENKISEEIGLTAGTYNIRITDGYYCSNQTYTLRVRAIGLPVTLGFNANGGSSNALSNTITAKLDSSVTIPSSSMSRTGYKFLGWSLDKNATAAQYTASAKITMDCNKILYAVWKPDFVTSQPKSTTAYVGNTATFSVTAVGSGTLQYQWQAKASGASSWSNSTQNGAKTAKLTIKTTTNHNGYQYRCIVKDGNGKQTTSKAVTLTIN